MKKKIFSVGVVLSILGSLGRFYANQQTTIGPDGILHETFLTPISAFLVLFGILALLISGVMYLTRYLQRL